MTSSKIITIENALLNELSKPSTKNRNSGKKDIKRNILKSRNSLKIRIDSNAAAGIKDTATMAKSKLFQGSLKKLNLCSSPKILMIISNTKNKEITFNTV